jgi:hypothetical protein
VTPRIVIHIGAPKTGSTFLQRAIRTDPALWRANGVHVPVLPEVEGIAGNAKLLAASLGGETPAFRRAFPQIDVASLDPAEIVSRLLADWQPEREVLLLSAENLDAPLAKPLRRLLPRDAACTVVLFIRNQHRWTESYYRQRVKMMVFNGTVGEITDTVVEQDGPGSFPDWHAVHEAWHTEFDDTRVVLFEEAGDLLATFATVADLPVPGGLPPLEPENVSLDAYQIAYLVSQELAFDLDEFKRRRRAANVAARRTAVPTVNFLSRRDRERIRARFEPGNRRLLELLGRDYAGSPLDLGESGADHVTLAHVRRSRSYKKYKKLADSIYAGSL